MPFRCAVGHVTYVFDDLKTLLARATPLRSFDGLAGIVAANAEERVAAQRELADLPLSTSLDAAIIPYETDNERRRFENGG